MTPIPSVPTPPRPCPICRDPTFESLFAHRDRMHALGGVYTVVQCYKCGLVSYEPFPDEQEVAAFYPDDYYVYRKALPPPQNRLRRLLDDLHLGLRHNPLLAIILSPLLWYKEVYSYARFLRPIPRGRLLDVGCGDGAFLLKTRRMGFDVMGLEPWGPAAANLADTSIPVRTCPLSELKGFDGSFDVITLNHVFEHLLRPEAALRDLRRLLAPGGRLLLRMPRTDHFMFRRFARCWYPLEMPRHVYLYTPENLTTLARCHGFQVESVVPECIPTHLQYALKAGVFRRDFGRPHWIDQTLFSFFLLPVCTALKLCGQADCMAVWLRREENP